MTVCFLIARVKCLYINTSLKTFWFSECALNKQLLASTDIQGFLLLLFKVSKAVKKRPNSAILITIISIPFKG